MRLWQSFALGVSGIFMIAAQNAAPAFDKAQIQKTHEIIACLIGKKNQIRNTLSYLPNSYEEDKLFIKSQPSTCISHDNAVFNQFIIPRPYFRGALAEYMLLSDFSAIGVSKHTPYRVYQQPTEQEIKNSKMSDLTKSHLETVKTLHYVVVTNPVAAFAVFETEPGDDEERSAINVLTSAISGCLVQGEQFSIQASALRAYLAEAAYRVSVAMFLQSNRVSTP